VRAAGSRTFSAVLGTYVALSRKSVGRTRFIGRFRGRPGDCGRSPGGSRRVWSYPVLFWSSRGAPAAAYAAREPVLRAFLVALAGARDRIAERTGRVALEKARGTDVIAEEDVRVMVPRLAHDRVERLFFPRRGGREATA
jgi:hypothetical protein